MEAPLYPGSRFLSLDRSRDLALLGGSGGVAEVVSISQKKIIRTLKAGSGTVTDGLWAGDRVVLATSTGTVAVFENDMEVSNFAGHAGEATSIALHPSREILASVGLDKSYIFYDLVSSTIATQLYTDSGQYLVFRADSKLTIRSSDDGRIPPRRTPLRSGWS